MDVDRVRARLRRILDGGTVFVSGPVGEQRFSMSRTLLEEFLEDLQPDGAPPRGERRCRNCRYFELGYKPTGERGNDGQCLRGPPTSPLSRWPIVPVYGWCGEWEARDGE